MMPRKDSKLDKHTAKDSEQSLRLARRVTWIGFGINALLGCLKVLGGILGKSSALVADGIHSFSDFLSDIIVIMMVGISHKKPNSLYQFGHGRFEALATVLLSILLFVVSIGIFYEGVIKIIDFYQGKELARPGYIVLIIIVLSIVSKEWLYHYTKDVGLRIKSEAIIANAWHHRSDSLSSLATLFGVCGAMFLGEKWRILDPIAAIVVGVFIFIVGLKLAKPAIMEMLGASLPKEAKKQIIKALKSSPGVLGWHNLQTFKSGFDGYVIVHIKVDANISVKEAHDIATAAEHRIRLSVSDLSIHTSTHIEPYKPRVLKSKSSK